jgi:hypothetical protein
LCFRGLRLGLLSLGGSLRRVSVGALVKFAFEIVQVAINCRKANSGFQGGKIMAAIWSQAGCLGPCVSKEELFQGVRIA